MYTTFNGSNDASAARWLHTLEHQVRGPNPNYNLDFLPPRLWLTCINGLLVGNAALWADHPRIKRILTANNLASASQKDVETFKIAFLARFPPARMTTDLCRSSLSGEPQTFAQGENEDIDSYYERAVILLHEKGGVDIAEAPLTELEQEGLNETILIYIQGLLNNKIHEEIESAWTESQDAMGLLDVHHLAKSQTLKFHLHMELKFYDHGSLFPDTEKPHDMSNNPIDDNLPMMQSPDKAGPIPCATPSSDVLGHPSSHPTKSQAMFDLGNTTDAACHNLNPSNTFEPAPEMAKENSISDLPTCSEPEQTHIILGNSSYAAMQIPTRDRLKQFNNTPRPGDLYPNPAINGPLMLPDNLSTDPNNFPPTVNLTPETPHGSTTSQQPSTPTDTPSNASTISTNAQNTTNHNVVLHHKHDADDSIHAKELPSHVQTTTQTPPSSTLFFF